MVVTQVYIDVALASNAETATGTSTTKAVTPAGLKSVFATDTEAKTGSATDKLLTASNLKAVVVSAYAPYNAGNITGAGITLDRDAHGGSQRIALTTATTDYVLHAPTCAAPTDGMEFLVRVESKAATQTLATHSSVNPPSGSVFTASGKLTLDNGTYWNVLLRFDGTNWTVAGLLGSYPNP